MPAYFAMRIETKYKEEGIESAKTYYNQMFSIELYKQFQEDTNTILITGGYGDVIPA